MATSNPGDYYQQAINAPTYSGIGNTLSWPSTGVFGNLTTAMTSTGPWTPTPPIIPDCDTISVLPDGRILVQGSGWKVAIPKHLFSNILAISEMGLLEKLVGEEKEDGK